MLSQQGAALASPGLQPLATHHCIWKHGQVLGTVHPRKSVILINTFVIMGHSSVHTVKSLTRHSGISPFPGRRKQPMYKVPMSPGHERDSANLESSRGTDQGAEARMAPVGLGGSVSGKRSLFSALPRLCLRGDSERREGLPGVSGARSPWDP